MTQLDGTGALTLDWFVIGSSEVPVATRERFLVALLGNDACIVGWVADDGRSMQDRAADGALHLTLAAVGELEHWIPLRPESPEPDAIWTPVHLDEVAIIVPTVEPDSHTDDDLGRLSIRVGRFEVIGLATPRVSVMARRQLLRGGGFVTLMSARIRHTEYGGLDINAPVALINGRRVQSATPTD